MSNLGKLYLCSTLEDPCLEVPRLTLRLISFPNRVHNNDKQNTLSTPNKQTIQDEESTNSEREKSIN